MSVQQIEFMKKIKRVRLPLKYEHIENTKLPKVSCKIHKKRSLTIEEKPLRPNINCIQKNIPHDLKESNDNKKILCNKNIHNVWKNISKSEKGNKFKD